MTKLLNRPLKAFALYSLIILLISVPVYVLVVDYIWVSELDENNWLTIQHTKERLKSRNFTEDDIEKINQIWGDLQPGVSIIKTNKTKQLQDSTYEAVRPNLYDKDDGEDRFRGLKSYHDINGEIYQITIETNVEESDETFAAVAMITLLFFIILILGFILLNRRIATKTWKPFYQTMRSLKSFVLSKDSTIHLPESDIQEFQELNQSLHQLIINSVHTYQQQKSFTENASHELQTPIALLKSRLDLLIQEKGVTPKISEILNSIEAPLSRLSRINKNLLLLAKVENHQYEEIESLSIKSYVENSLELFEDYSKNEHLKITVSLDHLITIEANPFLLETLINNLLSNAIRHSPEGGHLSITTQNDQLIFTNNGLESLNPEKLFKRFSRVSKDVVGSGLGLAIIKEITSKYGWSISYSFQGQKHIFSVTF